MENLFDLLIILFIIYAFLSPILKKRTPPVQKKPETSEPETLPTSEKEKSSQEILREIEELFGYKTEEPEPFPEIEDEEFSQITFEPETIEKKSQPKFEDEIASTQPKQTLEEKIHQDFQIEAYDYESTIPDTDIDEFDYSKLDTYELEHEDKTLEGKKFSLQLSEIDDFKKAVIYKEIFDTPIALRMRKIKWQRNIY